MTRYLVLPFVRTALNLGKPVEQFLGGFSANGHPAVRWIELRPESDEIVLSLYEVYDEGSEDWLDLYEFERATDDDLEQDEPAAEHRFSTLDDALAAAAERYGAHPERFVNAGVIQDEYHDHLARAKRSPGARSLSVWDRLLAGLREWRERNRRRSP